MKRFIMVLLIALLSIISVSAAKNTPHFKKCTKCIETRKKDKNCFYVIPYMRRDFGTPNKHKDGKAYECYRCQYGHTVWVLIED